MNKILPLLFLTFTLLNANAQSKKQILSFEFEEVKLSGILNIPKDNKPKGIVLIVHGSGQTDALAQEWYLDIRETIVKSGYATYMWDKMGCGKSEGVFNYNQSVQNSASEVIAAINYLKKKEIPGSDEIGLWGISRAGWINPIVISQYKDIKFWISVSGVDDKENFQYLFEENLKINGISKDTISILSNELNQGYRITHSGESYETYIKSTENLRKNKFLNRFNNGKIVNKKGYYEFQKYFMQQNFDKELGLQVYVKDFDSILSNINCPVLAVFGKKDKNNDWKKTKKLYKKTIGKNGNLSVKSLSDCNHNLFKCRTGGFYEFEDYDLPWDRCEGFLNTIENWLNDLK